MKKIISAYFIADRISKIKSYELFPFNCYFML